MIPILIQIKYSIYFLLFGIFMGSYFDLSESVKTSLEKSKWKIFKFTPVKKIIPIIIQLLLLTFLINISVEYTYKVSNGYAPIHISLFFLGGYLIYVYVLKKDMKKNLVILSYYAYKFNVFGRMKKWLKDIFVNTEIIEKIKKLIKRKVNNRKNKESYDIIASSE